MSSTAASAQRQATVRQCVIVLDDDLARQCGFRTDEQLPADDRGSALARIVAEAERFGVRDIILLAGDAAGSSVVDVDALRTTLPIPASLRFVTVERCAGIGEALRSIAAILDERFLLRDGRTLGDANLARMLAAAAVDLRDGLLMRLVRPNRRAGRTTLYYLLDRSALPRLTGVRGLATAFSSIRIARHRRDVTIAADARTTGRAERRALFLDRDGVINVDHGWVGDRSRFEWIPGALAGIRNATEAGWHVFIVTNQSGVAKGYYTEDDVRRLHDWVADQARSAGGTIDDARYCPFHPDAAIDRYRRSSDWRKPEPGMLHDLMQHWRLAPRHCALVGDQPTDIAAAAAAGMDGYRFPGGNLADFLAPILALPRYACR